MRSLIEIVSVFFIGLGVLLIVLVIGPLIEQARYLGSSSNVAGILVAALTPGGAVIIFGSVTFMLCSIDRKLGEMLDRPPPRPASAPASPDLAFGLPQTPPSRDHDLF